MGVRLISKTKIRLHPVQHVILLLPHRRRPSPQRLAGRPNHNQKQKRVKRRISSSESTAIHPTYWLNTHKLTKRSDYGCTPENIDNQGGSLSTGVRKTCI